MIATCVREKKDTNYITRVMEEGKQLPVNHLVWKEGLTKKPEQKKEVKEFHSATVNYLSQKRGSV